MRINRQPSSDRDGCLLSTRGLIDVRHEDWARLSASLHPGEARHKAVSIGHLDFWYRVRRGIQYGRVCVTHVAQHQTPHRAGQTPEEPTPGQMHGTTSIPLINSHGVGLFLIDFDARLIRRQSALGFS
jgi:hypothetical protein